MHFSLVQPIYPFQILTPPLHPCTSCDIVTLFGDILRALACSQCKYDKVRIELMWLPFTEVSSITGGSKRVGLRPSIGCGCLTAGSYSAALGTGRSDRRPSGVTRVKLIFGRTKRTEDIKRQRIFVCVPSRQWRQSCSRLLPRGICEA